MSLRSALARGALAFALLLANADGALARDHAADPALSFRITEGRVENAFVQNGPTAAHLLLNPGPRPRVLVAFPAGNSGVGVWFEDSAQDLAWKLEDMRAAAPSGAWHSIEAVAQASTSRLRVRDAVLGSVRVLRDFQLGQAYPPETRAVARIRGREVTWERARLDDKAGYRIALTVLNGTPVQDGDAIELRSDQADEPLRLRIRAGTSEAALTPFAARELLNANARDDVRSRQALQFLSYEEKFLAGSWRFDTYFGRDTLMSLRLLMPALQPRAVNAGLASVIARLAPNGEVAHEEDIGEFAVLRHRKASEGASAEPIYDYAMIDDDFMLPPVAAAWLIEDARGRAVAREFLAARSGTEPNGSALVRNLLFVADASEAFARSPEVANLIALKEGRSAGQWRDSNEGIGRGRYPYDVNAVWMPASLRAIAAFVESGLLDPYLVADQRARLLRAAATADAWERNAGALFTVRVPTERAAADVRQYASEIGVPDSEALAALPRQGLAFSAIALDAEGVPIPVLHSDEGFRLLFGKPDAASLQRDVANWSRPFPAGLMTDAGLLVANPVFAGREVWPRLGSSAYHGTVVWAWQQAVMAAGLRRQIERADLPAGTRAALERAEAQLWKVINAADAVRTSELWSWSYREGRYHVEPFGAQGAHEDESNAAQLWSTVFLALTPPPSNTDSRPPEKAAEAAAEAATP